MFEFVGYQGFFLAVALGKEIRLTINLIGEARAISTQFEF